jgi:hypothetical protein
MLIRPTTLVLLLAAGIASPTLADWPTSFGDPLYVGPLNNAFDERAQLHGSDDGSVWLAWQNNYCVGDVLLQRVTIDGDLLAPDAVAIQEDPTCGFHLPPLLIPIGDSAIASRASSSLQTTPVQRFDALGQPVWSPAYSTTGTEWLGGGSLLANGDVMILAQQSGNLHLDRLTPDGDRVWESPSVFASEAGSNFRVLDIAPHPDGGATLVWDAHLTYTKLIRAMRIDADGTPMWEAPVRMTDVNPNTTSSRHTRPSVISDGQGGALVFFAKGFETGFTPAPLLMQRIDADGSLAFSLDATRVSLGTERQFDPIAFLDDSTGDAIVVWRDGLLDGQSVRAQRIGIDGQRRWGDEGIGIGPIDRTHGSFDAIWNDGLLNVVIAGHDGISVSRINRAGEPFGSPIAVADQMPSSFAKITHSGRGSVVAWQIDVPETLDDELVAMRINGQGILGAEPCNSADLLPDANLDFFDVSAFLSRFASQDPAADQNGDGVFDFFDVSAFLNAFAAGCP